MSQSIALTGRCMCGAVVATGSTSKPDVAACHCDMCRRWSSGPYFEVSFKKATFEGEQNITKIRSSDWAERAFCKLCGSNLYYHIIGSDEYQISAGLLDQQSELQLTLQVFIDKAQPFCKLANETETMTAAQVYAKYAQPSD